VEALMASIKINPLRRRRIPPTTTRMSSTLGLTAHLLPSAWPKVQVQPQHAPRSPAWRGPFPGLSISKTRSKCNSALRGENQQRYE